MTGIEIALWVVMLALVLGLYFELYRRIEDLHVDHYEKQKAMLDLHRAVQQQINKLRELAEIHQKVLFPEKKEGKNDQSRIEGKPRPGIQP